MSAKRQFGKSTFRPSFGGVGASGPEDEENLNNAIIDDGEAGEVSASTVKSSAAFLNAASSSVMVSSRLTERSRTTMDVEAEETEKLHSSEDDSLPASALDDVLNDENSDSGENEGVAEQHETQVIPSPSNEGSVSPVSPSEEKADVEDSDSDDDMVAMSQATSSQKTIDEVFDSDSDDDDFPPTTSQSQGATQSQDKHKSSAALRELDENLFSDGEGEGDDTAIEPHGGTSQKSIPNTITADMDVEGAALDDDDSLIEEVARSQDTVALDDSDTESRGPDRDKDKSKKKKNSKKLRKNAESVSVPGSPVEVELPRSPLWTKR